jgi:hypothetical protein
MKKKTVAQIDREIAAALGRKFSTGAAILIGAWAPMLKRA